MERLYAKSIPTTGRAYVEVPHCAIWNLVEYLSFQRTSVEYGYTATHITVRFIHLNREEAQKLLDEWAASQMAPRDEGVDVRPHTGVTQ